MPRVIKPQTLRAHARVNMISAMYSISDQSESSEDTAGTWVPALFKSCKLLNKPKRILDLGGGPGNQTVDYAKASLRATLRVFDPFHKNYRENTKVLLWAMRNPVDYVTCANVVNVIDTAEARNILYVTAGLVASLANAKVIFQVYEGAGNGKPRYTALGWQENRKTASYLDEIRKVFPDATRYRNYIWAYGNTALV